MSYIQAKKNGVMFSLYVEQLQKDPSDLTGEASMLVCLFYRFFMLCGVDFFAEDKDDSDHDY